MAPRVAPRKYASTEILHSGGNDFRSRQEERWCTQFFGTNRKLHMERAVQWDALPNSVTALFMARGWCRFLNEPHDAVWATEVRLFYGTLVRTDQFEAQAYVDGTVVPFSLAILTAKLAEFGVPDPQEFTYPRNVPPVAKDIIMERIAPNVAWDGQTVAVGRIPERARLTFQIVCANLLQTSNDSAMRPRQATLTYHLFDPHTSINLARTLYADIFAASLDEKGAAPLPYARLITSILRDSGIEAPLDVTRIPGPFGQITRTKSAKQLAIIRARQGDAPEPEAAPGAEEEEEEAAAHDVEMGDASEDEESADEEDDPDFVWTGTDVSTRLSSLENRFENFMIDYRRDQSRASRMQADIYRRLGDPNEPLPSHFHDPYGPDAPSSSSFPSP